MITIHDIKLDFSVEDSRFARELYGRWDMFCHTGVEEVMDRVLSRYDSDEEVIRVGRMELDLGVLPEDEFYERFPKALEEKLGDVFYDLIRHREGRDVNIVSLRKDGLQALLYFLLYGGLPADMPEEYRDLRRLLEIVIDREGHELGKALRYYGEKVELRRRLVLQFRDRELEKVVEVTEPSEAVFIKVYTRSLISSWPRLRRPEITLGDYRNVVWEVVWAYLLYDGRGFFSRKQLVRQTITELASRFNLKFFYLLVLLTTGLKKMISGWLILPELSVILAEIRREEAEKMQGDTGKWQKVIEENGAYESADDLRKLLSDPVLCRRLLQPMKEEDIYRLTEVVIPTESRFVISYARRLEQEKEKGMLEGKAGSEFRVLKWEFLFQVLLSAPMSVFHRKRFVLEVIRRIAAHYNIDPLCLLVYLCTDQEDVPADLRVVLQQLYKEQTESEILKIAEAFAYRIPTERETEYLKSVLLHPRTARQLLGALPEAGIYRLVRVVIPAESTFVISYARTLDREKEKGMLEGKGGEEFRVLKWEFIFIMILSAPVSAFSRRQFVRSVLGQIAAHYNLAANDLVIYFYRALADRKTGFSQGVAEVLKEWLDEQQRNERLESEKEREAASRDTGRKLKELMMCPEMTVKVLEKAGTEVLCELWAMYKQTDTVVFIRNYKKLLWDFIGSSVVSVKRLYRQMQVVEGLADFLVKEYGRKAVADLLRKIGIRLQDSERLLEAAWREALLKKEVDLIREIVARSPDFLRRKISVLSPGERSSLEEMLKASPELLRKCLVCIGSPAMRRAVEEVIYLKRKVGGEENDGEWLLGLLCISYSDIRMFSYPEILRRFLSKMADRWTLAQRIEIYRQIRRQSYLSVHWEKIIEEEQKMEEAVEMMKREEKQNDEIQLNHMDMKTRDVKDAPEDRNISGNGREADAAGKHVRESRGNKNRWKLPDSRKGEERIYVANAGAIILAPYFPRLFDLLKMTEKGAFMDGAARVRAMFAIQYLVFGQTEFAETELALNKLLTAYRPEEPLPLSVELTSEEKEVLDSLLKGAMGNWSVMKGTSVDGFRGSFLIRNGVMADTGELWQLTVEEKSYDILLDSIPWSISPVKFPWMEKPLYVNWR